MISAMRLAGGARTILGAVVSGAMLLAAPGFRGLVVGAAAALGLEKR